LTLDRFTYAFADLRGYGRSRHIPGRFDVEEAANDVIALADKLGWKRFAVIGHSMSTIVAQHLACLAPQSVERIVLVTPVSPTGMRLDKAMTAMSRQLALANDEQRLVGARMMWGDRLSDTWIKSKLAHWRDAAAGEVAAAYVDLWGHTDVSSGAAKVRAPVYVLACEQDQPPFRTDAVKAWLRDYYPHAEIASLIDAGHYPMQEAPPLFTTLIERFLDR
jgi:pimeloyl-ACP methyl ester carboxylesterase